MLIRFHPDAEGELRGSFLWYESQRKSLGSEFARCVDEAIEKIRNRPEMYPAVHNHIRRVLVNRFPFGVFYESDPTEIRVLAIYHAKRNPLLWKTRAEV